MLEASLIPENQNKKKRSSPFDREPRAALMYLISKKLARGVRKFYNQESFASSLLQITPELCANHVHPSESSVK